MVVAVPNNFNFNNSAAMANAPREISILLYIPANTVKTAAQLHWELSTRSPRAAKYEHY
jgi:hypothetical protein